MDDELSRELAVMALRSLCNVGRGERERLIGSSLDALFKWYLDRSQTKRNWNPDSSFSWGAILVVHDPKLLAIIEGFYAVEQFAPDYTSETVSRNRDVYGRSQFHLRWGSEEAKHSDVWRNVLVYSGHRTEHWVSEFTSELRANIWVPPFTDPIEQLMYTVIQERATQINYLNLAKSQDPEKPGFKGKSDFVIRSVAMKLAIDESAHFNFFLHAARLYLYYFPERSLRALSTVLRAFVMPAADVIPKYDYFIEQLYEAQIFGKGIYARKVATYCLNQLGVGSLKHIPFSNGNSGQVESWVDASVKSAALFSAVDLLFSRLRRFYELRQLPIPAHFSTSRITWASETHG